MSLRTNAPSPAPEVHAMRADWKAGPSRNSDRRRAMAALHVLSEAGETAPEVAEETPPLPESLRVRWEEAYGRQEQVPRRIHTDSFMTTLREWLTPKSLAWAGGGMAAALLAVMFSLRQEPATSRSDGTVVTRGSGTAGVAETAAPVYVVGQPPAEALLARLREAFPARSIIPKISHEELPPDAKVVIEVTPAMRQRPDEAVSAVESIDEAAAGPN